MGVAASISAEVERHRNELQRLVSALKGRILSLPENPRAARLGRACIVQSRDVHSNWSAEHHDFRRQYEALVEAIETAEPDRALVVVQEAIRDGKLRIRSGATSWTLTLHPDVVGHLKGVLA